MKETYYKIDKLMADDENIQDKAEVCGATANCVVVTPKKIICVNAGDSRSILGREGGTAVPLSHDHKPTNPEETARAAKNEIDIMNDRLDGNLAVSRGLGDLNFKDNEELPREEQALTAEADIIELDRTDEDRFIVVACDGIWDCLTNEECATLMSDKLAVRDEPMHELICEMYDEIIFPKNDKVPEAEKGEKADASKPGTDNMSCILVKF